MPAPKDGPLLDGAAGRLVRPYTVSGGRTRPAVALDLLTLVISTGSAPDGPLGPEHGQVLGLCPAPTPVAEIAGRMGLPATVTKILLADLVQCGAIRVRPPSRFRDPTDQLLLEAVLDGLRRQL
ncbi:MULTISPECIES: DUF742 domain-containing protein [Streptomyces]|uniref:DUF742 domain-containing protein n=1 Tax=Streptomyces montanisoli TaxID=2798581 RepID=A0A940MA88_9ACTN|nr:MULTISPECIES: DUF742 domain-containing protein [Streptomyces]MBP0457228.1 DUF742 domain-containing protein [Streptomyces montanisoli]